jgi:hypothetical protein
VYGPVTTESLSFADVDLIGESAGDCAGSDVTGGGDVDGDGSSDVVIGAYGRSSQAGGVYLLTSFPSSSIDLSDATAIRTGEAAGDRAGLNVDLAGDVDGDGLEDIVVGADHAGTTAGAAYLLLGPQAGTASLATADAKLTGSGSTDGVGIHVRGAGDVDADGYDDLLIGSYASTAWLVNGPITGTSTTSAAAEATFSGEAAGFSTTMDGGGDADADGHADILIGSPYASSYTGAAYLFLGPLSGSYTSSEADIEFLSTTAGDYFASKIRFVGDHDGDGRDDFAFAAWNESDGGAGAGAVWVYLTSDL